MPRVPDRSRCLQMQHFVLFSRLFGAKQADGPRKLIGISRGKLSLSNGRPTNQDARPCPILMDSRQCQ